jgi:23S rRNA U2552 (ribose-2'-O)-methylase RlmE/FtsJ
MYTIQSRNFDFKLLSCGFRRVDLIDMCREQNGDLLKEILKEKERLSYLYESSLQHVYLSTRNDIFPELITPNILRSKAGLKLFEIMQRVDLSCKSFLDICAGPGAMSNLLLQSYTCQGVGITLCQEDKSKQFYSSLYDNNNYTIVSPDDGDITRTETISDVVSACDAIFGRSNVELIIADGAPSLEYHQENYQEIFAQKIILSEILLGLECIQRYGNFVIKIFDTFTKFSRCIVYLFSKIFNQVKIIKPPSSRVTNSEKYLIGKELILLEDKRRNLIVSLHSILYNFKDSYNCEEFISLEKDSRFEQTFSNAIIELGNNQVHGLRKILDQIDYKIFKVDPPLKTKGKGKSKGKGKGRGKGIENTKRYEPYKLEKMPAVELQMPPEEKDYCPFEEDSLFPE